MPSPSVVALAGPNGAGKSTAGAPLLKEALGVTQFVNADVIAAGLSAFAPEQAAIAAGRIMLQRLHQLARARATFAFETTLAGRSYAPWLTELVEQGYAFHLIFFFVPSAQFAIERVRDRVRLGGHSVPEGTVRRRYHSGLQNFFALYRPLAATWRVYDNSGAPPPMLVASGAGTKTLEITRAGTWEKLLGTYGGVRNAD